MKIGAAFPSKYLKCDDLGGKEHKLTISKVEMGDVGTEGKPEIKPIMFFVGKTRGVALNKTNATSIASRYGDDTDDWVNKEVIIYPDKTMFQGSMVDCIRMRAVAPVADPSVDDIPF